MLEFALALTLLTGGGLAIQSFLTLARVDLGFRAERLLTFSLPVAEGRLLDAGRVNAFYREVIERLQALPGVTSVSVSTGIPLRSMEAEEFSIAGRPEDPENRPRVGLNRVSTEYHETLGIRITRGRAFDRQDVASGQPVALVNEAFVRQFLPDTDPLTHRLLMQERGPGAEGEGVTVARQVVGVSADVRSGGPQSQAWLAIEVPFWQNPRPEASVGVRTGGTPGALQQAVAGAISELDPDLPLGSPKTMAQVVSEQLADDRFNMALFAGFAAVALVLASVGIYGVMSFVVAQRAREIGVRMALGARRGDVVARVVAEGMKTAVAGAVLGSAGAFFASQAMQSMLHGVNAVSLGALAGVVLTLLAAAFVACLLPARRAASLDPMLVLRED
jgi:putative ABC transport system permease protein